MAYNSGSIINCYVKRDLTVNLYDEKLVPYLYGYAGGIVGLSTGYISNSYYEGDINITCQNRSSFTNWTFGGYTYCYFYCGGLAGSSASIVNCYVDGNVEGSALAATWVQQTNSVNPRYGMSYCMVGALIGRGSISNSFTTALQVSAASALSYKQTGCAGTISGSELINNNCYYNSNCSLTGLDTTYLSGKACNVMNLKSRTWIINNLNFDEYNGITDIEVGKVWILQDGQYPKLWFELK